MCRPEVNDHMHRSSKDAKQGHGICSKSCRWNVAEEEARRKSILAQKQKSLDAKVSMKSFKDGKAARPTLAEEEARLRSLLASRIQKQRSLDAKKCTESFQASRSRMRSLPEPRYGIQIRVATTRRNRHLMCAWWPYQDSSRHNQSASIIQVPPSRSCM